MDRKNLLQAGRRRLESVAKYHMNIINGVVLFISASSLLNGSSRSLNASSRSLNASRQAIAETASHCLENYGTSLPVAVIELIGNSESTF